MKAGSRRERILVIEDEALVARELKSRLTQMGWEVVGIAYGDEAPAMARETRPDLILTDIHLKNGVDGIDMAREICRGMDIPVVFLTAYSDDETVSRAKAVTPFGYIIKPVENRELQITIEMALYKHSVDRELKETQQLLSTALACIGSVLVFLDDNGDVVNMNAEARSLFADVPENAHWSTLLGLPSSSSAFSTIDRAVADHRVARLSPFVRGETGGGTTLFDGMVGPMDRGAVLILRELTQIDDSIEAFSGGFALPGSTGGADFCQLVIVAAAGDGTVGERQLNAAAKRVGRVVRTTDLVSVMSDSFISASLPATTVAEAQQIARSILREIDGITRFAIGIASAPPGESGPIELFQRAMQAAATARANGGDRIVVFDAMPAQVPVLESQPREYREMLLLWNVMTALSRSGTFAELASDFGAHVFRFLGFDRLAILEAGGGAFELVAGFVRGTPVVEDVRSLGFNAAEFSRMSSLLADGDADALDGNRWFASLGDGHVLFASGAEPLAEASVHFLRTVVGYFTSVVSGLKLGDAAEESPPAPTLVFRSPQVEGISESVKLVAPTDATILINGESGTGKEMLARYIHEQSPRREAPFIIVDCGAVVSSLIESELFGHVKGAFTGADQTFSGRLREADGGTVLLDEIAELPIEVQVKLLRFVQNREFAPVGSVEYQTVDTRIIAATHRDLREMVAAGKFREDLYYRLNVFTLSMPPLRERPDDIILLARHYLRHFGDRYDRPGLRLSEDAERVLLAHAWPGNVRELVNVMNRAVIVCRDRLVGPIHLGLVADQGAAATTPASGDRIGATAAPQRSDIKRLLDEVLAAGRDVPLGRWLEDHLILTTVDAHGGVVYRAANSLGVPEATLRRRMSRLRMRSRSRSGENIRQWIDADALFAQLAAAAEREGRPLLEVAERALITELESRNLARKDAARLMGVSLPTYRKMLG